MNTLPIYMVAQGNFRPDHRDSFAGYLTLFEPLLREYDSETALVGGGFPVRDSGFWDMTWIVKFPTEAKMRGFLTDPRVIELRRTHENQIYGKLAFNFFLGHSPNL